MSENEKSKMDIKASFCNQCGKEFETLSDFFVLLEGDFASITSQFQLVEINEIGNGLPSILCFDCFHTLAENPVKSVKKDIDTMQRRLPQIEKQLQELAKEAVIKTQNPLSMLPYIIEFKSLENSTEERIVFLNSYLASNSAL